MFKILNSLGFLRLPFYNIMLVIGAVVALLILNAMMKKGGFSKFVKKRVRRSLFCAAMAATVLSTASSWFFHHGFNGFSILNVFTGGGYSMMVWVLCFIGISALILRIYKLDVAACLDVVIPPLLFATVFARIGCMFGGCCYGIDIHAFNMTLKVPVRELEALFALVMGIILCAAFRTKRLKIYMIAYPAFRFFAEFLRGDDRGSIFGITVLSPAQVIAAVTIITAMVIPMVKSSLNKNKPRIPTDTESSPSYGDPFPYGSDDQPGTGGNSKGRPVDFDDPAIKTNPIGVIVTVLLALLIAFGALVAYNPFRVGWISGLSYTIKDRIESFGGEKGETDTIGISDSLDVIDVSDAPAVVGADDALTLISSYDEWNGSTYDSYVTADIADDYRMYVFIQTVDGVPVYGKSSMLVTDENNIPLYVIRDAANDVYSNEIIITNLADATVTYRDYLGDGYTVMDSINCLYDSTEGLISAKLLSVRDQNNRQYGVLVDAATECVIKITPSDTLLSLAGSRSGAIIESAQKVAELIRANNKDAIRNLKKTKIKSLSIENSPNAIAAAICKAYDKCGVDSHHFITALNATNEIARMAPNLNEQLYEDIFVHNLRQVMIDSGMSPKKADKCVKKARSAFKSYAIKDIEDEATVSVDVKDKKNVFKNTVGSANDVDLFLLHAEENNAIKLNISSDIGIDIEIFTDSGTRVLTTYTSSEHELMLYPEDGSSFVVKVKASDTQGVVWAGAADYKLSVSAKEQDNTMPRFISDMLYELIGAYETSDVYSYAYKLYGEEAYTLEEYMLISSLPAADNCMTSCSGCMGDSAPVQDSVKSFILTELAVFPEEHSLFVGPDAVMELSCFRFVETENGALVKAKLTATDFGGVVYDGYTYLRLEYIKEAHTFDFIPQLAAELDIDVNKAQKLADLLNLASSNRYYITEMNTAELLAAFGDTFDNMSDEYGTSSLYDFWQQDPASPYSFLKTFDAQAALNAGHSMESVEEFAKYTIMHNAAYCEKARDDYENKCQAVELFSQGLIGGYELYSIIDDPIGYLIDESTDSMVVKATYRIGKIAWGVVTGDITDILDAVTGEAMGDFVEQGINSYADQLKKDAKELQKHADKFNSLMEDYDTKLKQFEKSYSWEDAF